MDKIKGILGTNKVAQVGIIVRDIEISKKTYAEFFGVDVPEHSDGGDYEVTGTVYRGEPAPEANSKLAFFDGGDGLQVELIEPNGKPSAWQEFLDEKGEGLHHIAFNIENMDEMIKRCEDFGMTLVQRGKYASGDGEYAYLDAGDTLSCYIELLESF